LQFPRLVIALFSIFTRGDLECSNQSAQPFSQRKLLAVVRSVSLPLTFHSLKVANAAPYTDEFWRVYFWLCIAAHSRVNISPVSPGNTQILGSHLSFMVSHLFLLQKETGLQATWKKSYLDVETP